MLLNARGGGASGLVGSRAQAASPTLAAAAVTTERRDSRVARITSNEGPFIATHANVATFRRPSAHP